MKALITAGGRATRLRPITHTVNKHLIPLANEPMLFHAIRKIAETGVKEIGININPGETEIQKACGSGERWGVSLTYIEQIDGPKGLSHIIMNAQTFIGDDSFIFYLGDNIILGSINDFVMQFEREKPNAFLALSKVKDPQRFGVPVIEGGNIVRVDEKPTVPGSDYAVTGIYIYDANIFKAAAAIEPSPRGEYEISDAHTWLINNGFNIGYREITGWWKDTGKPEDLLEGNQLILNEMQRDEALIEGEVDSSASIQGRVKIGKGTTIGPGTLIRGPVVVGDNCVIEGSYIGPHTSIGNGVEIDGTEIEHAIVMDHTDITCGRRIVDAIIGKNATVTSASDTLPRGHRLIIGDNSVVEI